MYVIMRRRHIFAAIVCLVAVAVGIIGFAEAPAVATAGNVGNWGLHFNENGKLPTANVSAETLAPYNAFFCGDTGKKVLYLTFDAGFDNGYTAPILDILKKHQVPATFFVVGHFLESVPDLVKRMVAEGHLVGNHTYHHPDMSAIATVENFAKELQTVENKYKEIIGKDMPKLYRPPQGKFSEQNLKMAKDAGYTTAFWSLAYVDWYADKQPTKEEAFSKLLPRTHDGAVVLLHSTSRTNCEILDELITKWKEMGYTFASLDTIKPQDAGHTVNEAA